MEEKSDKKFADQMKVSVVICTYNPDQKIISCLFDSLRDMSWPRDIDNEILLIDNASVRPLADEEYVKSWQTNMSVETRVIREDKPGLSNARLRGLKESAGDFIVFYDDDNKPAGNYIVKLLEIEKKYPFVGIWGPGNVEVEWMPGANPAIQKQFEDVYQKHHQDSVTYALDFVSPNTMPYGTGMILRKEVAGIYMSWLEQKERKTTGRIGKSLTSYEDVQICWLGMEAGWAVGRHPDLKMTHVISADKAQWDYLAKLKFGIYSSFAPALKEAMPHRSKNGVPNSVRLMGFLSYHFLAWLSKPGTPPLRIYMAKHLGQPVGAWSAEGVTPPWWISKIVDRFYLT